MLFSRSLISFMPPMTRGPLFVYLRTLAPPPGLLGQCLPCSLVLPMPALSWGSVGCSQ